MICNFNYRRIYYIFLFSAVTRCVHDTQTYMQIRHPYAMKKKEEFNIFKKLSEEANKDSKSNIQKMFRSDLILGYN